MRTYRFGEFWAVAVSLALCASAAGAHTWHVSDGSDGKKATVVDAGAVTAGAGAAAPADKATTPPSTPPKETKATPAAQPEAAAVTNAAAPDSTKPVAAASPTVKATKTTKTSEPYLGASAPDSVVAPSKDTMPAAGKSADATPASTKTVAPTEPKRAETAVSKPVVPIPTKSLDVVPTKTAETKSTMTVAPTKSGSTVSVQGEKKESAAPVVSAPAQPPQWDKAEMRLSGSMCVACLKELEENLLKLPGVSKVRVDRPEINYFQPVSPEVSNWAQAIIIYDEHRIDLEYLRNAIRQNGYHSYKVTTKQLNHEPDAKDLKF